MNAPLQTEPIGNAAIVAMPALSHSPRCHAYEAELRHYRVDVKPDFGQCNRCEISCKLDLEKGYSGRTRVLMGLVSLLLVIISRTEQENPYRRSVKVVIHDKSLPNPTVP